MKKIFFIGFLFLFLLEGNCQSANKSNELKKGWNLLETEIFSIQYPQTWEALENRGLYLYPKQKDLSKEVIEGISLRIEDFSFWKRAKIDNLDEYINFQKSGMAKIIEDERLENNNCHHLVYLGSFDIIEEDYYWVINDKIYILKFTAEQDKYQSCKKIAGEIMSTFKIKDKIVQ